MESLSLPTGSMVLESDPIGANTGMQIQKSLDDYDFKLVISLGLLGLPLPGPVPFSRYLKVLKTERRWAFLRMKVDRDLNPWKDIFKKIGESAYSDAEWMPKPVTLAQEAGSDGVSCHWRDQDALAAYIHALLWYFDRNPENARAALRILKTWERVASGNTGFNACHESDWAMLVLSGAGEILIRTRRIWADDELKEFFTTMERVCFSH